MADDKKSCCCSGKTVMLYACSGGANVGEMSDHVARDLMFAGKGTMFCLAGIGGAISGMIETAKAADVNLLIDGCPMDCAKKTFETHGIGNFTHLRITDLGIEKKKGVRATEAEIAKVMAAAEASLTKAKCGG